jgi:hypothetical protein
VHAGYAGLGIRYQADLTRYWEFVDPHLLETRLLESLFHLHSQPPLFNLFLGLGLKTFPERWGAAFHVVYLLIGLALYVSVLLLMRRLGVRAPLAFGIGSAFLLSPSFVLYEHLLFYMLPIALLLAGAPLVLHAAIERQRTAWYVGFFTLAAVLCALQSVFHLAYYVVVVATVTAALGAGARARIVRASVPPFVALSLLYAKNAVLFGTLTTSSWAGMHMADMTTEFVPRAEREQMVARGRLSPLSLITPFSPAGAYPAEYFQLPTGHSPPLLSMTHTSAGTTNYHHLGYLAIARTYRDDALYVAWSRPLAPARAFLRAWWAYFKPSTDYFGLEPNRSRIERWRALWDRVVYGRASWLRLAPRAAGDTHVALLVGLPLVWGVGVYAVFRGRSGRVALTGAQRAMLALICVDVAYVALVVNSLAAGENQRFRFVTDGLSAVLLAVLIARLRRPWAPPRGPQPPSEFTDAHAPRGRLAPSPRRCVPR